VELGTASCGQDLDGGRAGIILELDVEEGVPSGHPEHVRERRHAQVGQYIGPERVDPLRPALDPASVSS
jgi:hypothetical protein